MAFAMGEEGRWRLAELESEAGFLMVWRGGLAREGLLVKQKVSESIRRVDIGLFKGCKGRSGE